MYTKLLFTFLMLNLLAASQLKAADGTLEINQSCASQGCFSGDNPGFPVEITTAGSYILTGSLFPADSGGIEITAPHVSLNLNGFEIVGDDVTFESGINILMGITNTEVSNGTIRDFGNAGVYCEKNFCHQSRFTGLRVISNGQGGLTMSSSNGVTVRDSHIEGNGFGGIFLAGLGIIVSGCTVMNNAGTDAGIRAGNYSIVSGNIVYNNAGHGIHTSDHSTVIGNVVSYSGQHGINLGVESLVKNNTAHNNNQSAGKFVNIEDCVSCTFVDNESS